MDGGGMKRIWVIILAALIVGAGVFSACPISANGRAPRPQPRMTVAAASLQGLREQNRLTPFAGRFVAVVTSTQTRFGLSARKTMIMPGTVRYEIDLARLQQRDLRWNPETKTLTVTLPPSRSPAPRSIWAGSANMIAGGVLMALTNAGQTLDATNRAAGPEAARRAGAARPAPLRLARDAAPGRDRAQLRHAAARGRDRVANVRARFADEAGRGRVRPNSPIISRSLNEVYAVPK